MISAFYNTKEQGVLHFIYFKEGSEHVAVCLNFDLVEYGKNPEELRKSIEEAAQSYLEAVKKTKLPDDYLNVPTNPKYIQILKDIRNVSELRERSAKRSLPTKIEHFTITSKSYNRQATL